MAHEKTIEYLEKQVEYERSEKKEIQRKLDKVFLISNDIEEIPIYQSGIKPIRRGVSERIREVNEDNEVPGIQEFQEP